MKYTFVFGLLFLSLSLCGQETEKRNEIFFKKHLAYGETDKQLYTGKIKYIQRNGIISLEEDFSNGYKTKHTVFYSDKEKQNIYTEIYYYPNSFRKQKEIKYNFEKTSFTTTRYDNNGKKEFVEIYEFDKLIYSCEYRDNKKNGKEFCVTKKGENQTEYYSKGKKIKT